MLVDNVTYYLLIMKYFLIQVCTAFLFMNRIRFRSIDIYEAVYELTFLCASSSGMIGLQKKLYAMDIFYGQ